MKLFESIRAGTGARRKYGGVPASLLQRLKCWLGAHNWCHVMHTTADLIDPLCHPQKVGKEFTYYCRHCDATHTKRFFRSRNAFNDWKAWEKKNGNK